VETFSRETLDPWFVSGFADGQANFTFSRSSRQIALYFAIKAAMNDDILELIQQFFDGVGRIYTITNTTRMYRITRAEELKVVVQHFDRYPLRSRKRDSYQLWREMVELKVEFRRGSKEALQALAARLSSRGSHGQN
jgi:hypothetical protein